MAVATPERLALAEKVRELRDQGLRLVDVAERLGISYSYTQALDVDPDGSEAAARKERYRLPCPRCGTLMSGSAGISGAPSHCFRCSQVLSKVWTKEAVVHALRRWYAVHGRTPRSRDWVRGDPDGLHPAQSAVHRAGGSNPSAVFDTWNDALSAAGLPLNKQFRGWTRWTTEMVVAEIAKHCRDGYGPSEKWMGKLDYARLYQAGVRHFGSWGAACAAAGVVPRGRS